MAKHYRQAHEERTPALWVALSRVWGSTRPVTRHAKPEDSAVHKDEIAEQGPAFHEKVARHRLEQYKP